jgi:hypothetical protein
MTQTWWCYWEADFYPSEGIVEVEAEDATEASILANRELTLAAAMGEGPQDWHWVYAPTSQRPAFLDTM